jgi:O-antigen/teichoic acid export membrane protein
MSKIKKIATLSIGQGINVIVNFLFLPYMARVLSYEDYGSYGQVLLISSFTIALFSFGLSQIIFVYLTKKDTQGSVLTSNLFAGLLLGFLSCGALFFSSDLFANYLENPAISRLIKIYSFTSIFIIPFASINAYLVFKDKVKSSVGISVLSNLIKVILVVYAIQIHESIGLSLLFIGISSIIQFSIGCFLIRNKVNFSFPKQLLLEQLQKGLPLGLTGILGTGILYIDGLMVSKIEGVEAFAIYRNGAIEVPYLAAVYASIAAIILPEVAKLYAKGSFAEIVRLKKKVIQNTMMITYPVLIFLLFNATDFIILYLGEKYSESALIFAVFNLTLLMRVNDYHDVIVSANRSKLLLCYYGFVFILNVILNYFFIIYLGILGAAIATVSSLFIFAYILLQKSMKLVQSSISKVVHFRSFIGVVVICSTLAFLLSFTKMFVDNRVINLVLAAAIFFPVSYFILLKFNFFSESIKNKVLTKLKL